MRLTSGVLDGGVDKRIKLLHVMRRQVGQGPVLGVIPDLLHRVEVRGVCWKPLDRGTSSVAQNGPPA
jgi:hypothetical protein